ncbi:MAG: hypothetical protein E7358_00660 [Clostridiales bacterium]|nr:hypothetical protein [Clostridiales bacterium]
MQVYIEYAFLDNLIINYLLLKTATRCAKIKTRFIFLFLSALVGTVFAIIFPLVRLNNSILFLIKILLACVMVYISGRFITVKSYFITLMFFILFTFLCGGFLIALFNFSGVDYNEYFLFNNDSVLPICISVLIIYLTSTMIVKVTKLFVKERNLKPFLRNCALIVNGKKFIVKGFIDSGNGLYDSRSGFPVIVCSNDLFSKLQSANIKKSISKINFDTVSGTSTMQLYVIDKIMIYNGSLVNIYNNVLIGVSEFGFTNIDYDLLLHPHLL